MKTTYLLIGILLIIISAVIGFGFFKTEIKPDQIHIQSTNNPVTIQGDSETIVYGTTYDTIPK